MLIYLIKFSACLAIFMVFYKLLLERENMHHLKRYFLLSALVMALAIPFVTFTEYIEPVSNEALINTNDLINSSEVEQPPLSTNYLPIIVWSIYAIGALLFGIKFVLNLSIIFYRIKRNPKYKTKKLTNVLLNDLVIPHTFFNFIFLNRQKFETKQIPKEVFIHEEAHARQKHSFDVLLIEFLQIILWFNPLIYLMKESIKMNHEFMADEAVLKHGIETSTYQQLLLTFSSNVAEQPQLANAINYSSIKKRFTVMKTHTSKQKIWLRSLLLLPLLAITLYGFSEKKIIEKEIFVEKASLDSIDLYLNEKGELLLNEKIITLEEIQELYMQNKNLYISIKAFPNVDSEIVKKTVKEIQAIGFKKMTYCTSGDTVNATPEENRIEMMNSLIESQKQEKATSEEVEWYNTLIKDINSKPENRRIFKHKDIIRLENIYKRMSNEQKANSEPFPNFPPPPPPPPTPEAPKLNMEKDVPPPPPAPITPLDHVIKMAKKGAVFYYEGKSISSDDAIKLLKENDELNIQTKESNSNKPKIYITKDPIVIKE